MATSDTATMPHPTPRVHLVQVTRENVDRVLSLCVAPDQERFVGTPAEAIAKFHFDPDATALAICDYGTRKIVGLLVYCIRPGKRDVELCRFLVDCKEQRRGYGGAALQVLISLLHVAMFVPGDGGATAHVYTHVANVDAHRLYRRAGFVFDEEPCDQDNVHASLVLTPM